MVDSEKNIIHKLTSLMKKKFFFCNSTDDVYYQFTENQINKLVEDICNSDSIEEYCKRGY